MDIKVSNVIDVARDLSPFGFSAIYSGVGTGKNSFIEGLLTEDGTFKGGLSSSHKVLLVTSRKAKVEETFKRHGNGIKNFVKQIYDKEDIAFPQEIEDQGKSVVCTNSHFAKRLKSVRIDDSNYYFWEQFEYIIFDEFHSIVMDATFTENCHLIKFFLDYFYDKYVKNKESAEIKKHILFMSGTPEPAEEIIEQYDTNILDYRKVIQYNKPQKYYTIPKARAFAHIFAAVKLETTSIYFMCHLNSIDKIIDMLRKKGIDVNNCVAVYISDEAKMKELQDKHKEIYDASIKVKEAISTESKLPNNIKVLLTNNACKEGINILSKVENIFVESHLLIDIIQMCGRVRDVDKVENVYLIKDARQFQAPVDKYKKEKEYQVNFAKDKANEFFAKLCKEGYYSALRCAQDVQEVKEFIDYIESGTRYIRYNPLKEIFEENTCYDAAVKYIEEALEKFSKNFEHHKKHRSFVDKEYEEHFDGSKINDLILYNKERKVLNYFREEWEIEDLLGHEFNSSDKEKIFNDLARQANMCGITSTYKTTGQLLRAFGFKFVYNNPHKTKTSRFKIVKEEK